LVRDTSNHVGMPSTTIIVPGFMGSDLVDASSGKKLWSATRLFWARLERMRLAEDEETDAEPGVRIEPGGDFWPVYRGLMRDLRRAGRRVEFFAFDWRRSAAEAADRLGRFVEEKAGGEEVDLVTHSMGGVIAALWLASGGKARLGRMVGIALPAGGVEMALSALFKGNSRLALFNIHSNRKSIRRLVKETPSLYEMLPQLAGIYDPARWEEKFKPNEVLLVRARRVRSRFEDGMRSLEQLGGAGRVALIAGVGSKTIAWRRDLEGMIGPELETHGEGDGWVLKESACPKGIPAYGFHPGLGDILSLGTFASLAILAGIHPILPMFRRVREAVMDYLEGGAVRSLPPMAGLAMTRLEEGEADSNPPDPPKTGDSVPGA
jgi:pimeloyl-ACP methyl ester carboxylesterase